MASLSVDQYDLMIWYRICYLWKLLKRLLDQTVGYFVYAEGLTLDL